MGRSDPHEAAQAEKQRNFVRAMSKSIDGQPLSYDERDLLNTIFEALLRGEDVSELTGVRRPHTRRASDPLHISLHYLCLTQLMRVPAEEAWALVGEAWGLRRRELQPLIVQNREQALAALRQFADAPERLLGICERHARGLRLGRGVPEPRAPADGTDDTLIPMLARLCEVQPAGLQ